jgi:hypothetical protein
MSEEFRQHYFICDICGNEDEGVYRTDTYVKGYVMPEGWRDGYCDNVVVGPISFLVLEGKHICEDCANVIVIKITECLEAKDE